MSLFKDLLEDITKRLHSGEVEKIAIAKEISDTVGVVVSPDQIKIRNGTLTLIVSPTIKSIVYLKRAVILTALNKFNIKTIA